MLPVGLLSVRCCKPLSLLSFTVIVFVVLGCAVAYFLFSEGEEIFLIQFCLRGKGGSSFASFGLCLGLRGLQMCLHLCVGYLLLTSFQNFDSLLLSITPSYFNNSSIGTTSLHALDCACLVCLFSIVSIIP